MTSISQIDLVLTLEENIPEYFHQKVIVKQSITVQPRKVEKIIKLCKLCTAVSCTVCSCISCNINHGRYWIHQLDQPNIKEPSKIYNDIPELNKQIESLEVYPCSL